MRIGHGYDIHRMASREETGQPMTIGGGESERDCRSKGVTPTRVSNQSLGKQSHHGEDDSQI